MGKKKHSLGRSSILDYGEALEFSKSSFSFASSAAALAFSEPIMVKEGEEPDLVSSPPPLPLSLPSPSLGKYIILLRSGGATSKKSSPARMGGAGSATTQNLADAGRTAAGKGSASSNMLPALHFCAAAPSLEALSLYGVGGFAIDLAAPPLAIVPAAASVSWADLLAQLSLPPLRLALPESKVVVDVNVAPPSSLHQLLSPKPNPPHPSPNVSPSCTLPVRLNAKTSSSSFPAPQTSHHHSKLKPNAPAYIPASNYLEAFQSGNVHDRPPSSSSKEKNPNLCGPNPSCPFSSQQENMDDFMCDGFVLVDEDEVEAIKLSIANTLMGRVVGKKFSFP